MGVDIHGVFQRRTSSDWEDVETHYDEIRDYFLFAWLGGVCNGHDCTAVAPLSENRGYPEGFAITSDNKHDGRWCKAKRMGEHSHSWISADEILQATPPRVLRSGVVDRKLYDSWDGVSQPREFAGDVAEIGAVVKSHPSEVSSKTTHVRVEWFVDGARTLEYFVAEVRRLKEEHGDIRFVFGFDGDTGFASRVFGILT
jgi:hypothetical protein